MCSLITALVISIMITIPFVYAQTSNVVTEQVKEANNQADIATIVGGGGIAGAIATFATEIWNQKKNKKEDKLTDADVGRMFALIGKIMSYAYVIDPHFKKVLDSPIDANPMNKDIKIGHEFAKELQEWLDYMKTTINVQPPNMAIAIQPENPAIKDTNITTENKTEAS